MGRMAWVCQSSVMVLYRVIYNQHPMIVPSSAEKLKGILSGSLAHGCAWRCIHSGPGPVVQGAIPARRIAKEWCDGGGG
jgi:hypothetical protein